MCGLNAASLSDGLKTEVVYVGKTESPRRNHGCFLRRGKLCRG
nr:MAG TPA: hypothetical protein [Caudoviricetes sp.]